MQNFHRLISIKEILIFIHPFETQKIAIVCIQVQDWVSFLTIIPIQKKSTQRDLQVTQTIGFPIVVKMYIMIKKFRIQKLTSLSVAVLFNNIFIVLNVHNIAHLFA